jgi:ABC-2 type transport system permease protein
MNFLVLPIFFLSGALFPLNNLPRVLTWITSADPLAYGIDGMRSALIGIAHFGPAIDGAVLACVAVLFLSLGAYTFSKIEI